ncbi:unnamed protein product [Lactuca saligna]|uniref:Uncharacterized protein n=1 Tax=Lactuca saligna TaxID=75948 RepID=A0AA35YG73_LACSI|nr:unnamed protein product [Lactuca saligna]
MSRQGRQAASQLPHNWPSGGDQTGRAAYLELAFERHQRPMYAEAYRELTLRDVMQILDAIQEEHHWIMLSIFGVMQHLGMDHPPFPQACPTFPPYTQPKGAGYDGACPLGINHGDTDDDITEDEEDNYESSDE